MQSRSPVVSAPLTAVLFLSSACAVEGDGLGARAVVPAAPDAASMVPVRVRPTPDAAAPVDAAPAPTTTPPPAAMPAPDARTESVADAAPSLPPPAADASAETPAERPPSPDAAPVVVLPPPPVNAPPTDPARGTCPADDALALCLRFEGNIGDESRRRHIVSHARVEFSTGPSGRAASLGPQSVLRALEARTLDLPAYTIEAWVNPRVMPQGAARAGIVDNDGQYGLFLLSSGAFTCSSGMVAASSAPAAAAAGRWTSVACVLGDGQLSLWLNGARVAQVPAGPAPVIGANGVTIGANNPSGDNLDGLLDNVRIWSSVRTQAQLCGAAHDCRD